MPLMFAKPTVTNRIVFYLRHHPGWRSTVELQAQGIHWQTTGANIARRSRELAKDNKIEVQLDYRGLAQYRYKHEA